MPSYGGGGTEAGGIAGFIDAEHALDPVYAKNIGVDIDNLYISQPDNGEQGPGDHRDDGAFRSGGYRDRGLSGSLVPKAEIDGDMEIPMWAFRPGSCPRPSES